MLSHSLFRRTAVCAAGFVLVAFSSWASADPPARVARLGYIGGAVSFSPAGEDAWSQALRNRPLVTGDRLWADTDARTEIQLGSTMLRMGPQTSVAVLNLDDQIAQMQLTQGTLDLHIRALAPGQLVEVDTPNLAFVLREVGDYRVDVDADGQATNVIVRSGRGEVNAQGTAYSIYPSQAYRFMGTDLSNYAYLNTPAPDALDTWGRERDMRYDASVSARYVSPGVVGFQDLDANGTWRTDSNYGNVWVPNGVPQGWSPYRDGHWAWVDPWGWTWIDDAPWGYAVSHYGRWANLGGSWAWVPGPLHSTAYYAPALVAFVGGDNFRINFSGGNVAGIGWFPLAPREVYRPSYAVSPQYLQNLNRSNTVITNTVLNTVNTTTNVTNVTYLNRQAPNAVVVVPTTTFVQSQPVSRAVVHLPQGVAATVVSQASVAPVAPASQSVHGAAAASAPPPARVFARPVLAYSTPAVVHAGFAAQQPHLATQAGKPLDEAARKQLQPAAVAPAVTVLAPRQASAVKSATPLGAPPAAVTGRESAPRSGAVPQAPQVVPPATPAPQAPQAAKPATLPMPRPAEAPTAATPPPAPAATRQAPAPAAPHEAVRAPGAAPVAPAEPATPVAPAAREVHVPAAPVERAAAAPQNRPAAVVRPVPQPPAKPHEPIAAPREPSVVVPREEAPRVLPPHGVPADPGARAPHPAAPVPRSAEPQARQIPRPARVAEPTAAKTPAELAREREEELKKKALKP